MEKTMVSEYVDKRTAEEIVITLRLKKSMKDGTN